MEREVGNASVLSVKEQRKIKKSKNKNQKKSKIEKKRIVIEKYGAIIALLFYLKNDYK